MNEPLLSVSDLRTHFDTDEGTVRSVDGVSFEVESGETVAIVGESGAGKTVTAESLTRIFRSPPGEVVGGSVVFDGVDLTELDDGGLREYRGSRVAHIFQNPQGALNPVYTVGWQLREAVRLHRDVTDEEADEVATDLLERVGIPDSEAAIGSYPHELSGGQKQRVVVAMALAGQPDLLVADEPTTALDVTTQAGILEMLNEIQEQLGMAMLYITHDLGVVAGIADRVVVMYSGKVMETGPVEDVLKNPAHPYTRALLRCLPERGGEGLGGTPPDPADPPSGCRFHPRCPDAVGVCEEGEQPRLRSVGEGEASCVYYGSPTRDPEDLEDVR